MNKKRYVTPNVNVIALKTTELMVSVSGGGAASDIRWGGSGIDEDGNGREAGSREGRFWDEE